MDQLFEGSEKIVPGKLRKSTRIWSKTTSRQGVCHFFSLQEPLGCTQGSPKPRRGHWHGQREHQEEQEIEPLMFGERREVHQFSFSLFSRTSSLVWNGCGPKTVGAKAHWFTFFLSLSSCCLAPDMGDVAGSGRQREIYSDFLPKDWKEELQRTAKSQGDCGEGRTGENNPIEWFMSS